MSRLFQDHSAGGFRLDSPVKLPVASEMPRCAPPHTLGPGRNHWEGEEGVSDGVARTQTQLFQREMMHWWVPDDIFRSRVD